MVVLSLNVWNIQKQRRVSRCVESLSEGHTQEQTESESESDAKEILQAIKISCLVLSEILIMSPVFRSTTRKWIVKLAFRGMIWIYTRGVSDQFCLQTNVITRKSERLQITLQSSKKKNN